MKERLSPITEPVMGCLGFAKALYVSSCHYKERKNNQRIYMENGWLAPKRHPTVRESEIPAGATLSVQA